MLPPQRRGRDVHAPRQRLHALRRVRAVCGGRGGSAVCGGGGTGWRSGAGTALAKQRHAASAQPLEADRAHCQHNQPNSSPAGTFAHLCRPGPACRRIPLPMSAPPRWPARLTSASLLPPAMPRAGRQTPPPRAAAAAAASRPPRRTAPQSSDPCTGGAGGRRRSGRAGAAAAGSRSGGGGGGGGEPSPREPRWCPCNPTHHATTEKSRDPRHRGWAAHAKRARLIQPSAGLPVGLTGAPRCFRDAWPVGWARKGAGREATLAPCDGQASWVAERLIWLRSAPCKRRFEDPGATAPSGVGGRWWRRHGRHGSSTLIAALAFRCSRQPCTCQH